MRFEGLSNKERISTGGTEGSEIEKDQHSQAAANPSYRSLWCRCVVGAVFPEEHGIEGTVLPRPIENIK